MSLGLSGCGNGGVSSTGDTVPGIPLLVGGFVREQPRRLETDAQLKMSVVPQFEFLRGQAPLNCALRMQWNGPGLLEGRALCDLYVGEIYVGSWRSQDVAVTDQVLVLPVMFPPAPLNSEKESYTLQLAFETDERTITVDSKVLLAEPCWSRRFLLGVVAPKSASRLAGFASSRGPVRLSELFQLADFHRKRELGSEFNVSVSIIEEAEVPIEPLRLSAFDLILLSAEALPDLRPNQLEAIVRWVRAGGRLCVVATHPVPQRLQSQWQRLLSQRADSPEVRFDKDGRPRPISGESRARYEPGCGRVLALFEPTAVDDAAWTSDVAWLFSILSTQTAEIERTGSWRTPEIIRFGQNYERIRPFGPTGFPVDSLIRPLLPENVQGVSFWRVLGLLGACLLLIGPVDYYVLGRLRLRRLTWVFLPVVALSATWAMVRMSQASLGQQDSLRSLAIADVGADAQIARVSTFQLQYDSAEETRIVDRSGSYRIDFLAPIVGRDVSAEMDRRWQSGLERVETMTAVPIRYEGIVPGTYRVWEPMQQWTPRLFRDTTFGPGEIDGGHIAAVDWDSVDALPWWTEDGRGEIAKLIQSAIPGARVLMRTGTSTLICDSGLATETDVPSLMNLVGEATSEPSLGAAETPNGLFGMIAQRSPTGGPDLEDFRWIDPDDPDDAALLIGTGGDEAVVFRKKLKRPEAP